MNTRRCTLSLCLISSFILAPPVFAGDISSDLSRGQYTGDGGYFEIGAMLFAGNSPVVGVPDDGDTVTGVGIPIAARWQHGPAFVEVNGLDNLNIGLNLWSNDNWWVDAVISQNHGGLDPDDIDALENSNLRKRSADYPLGIRATRYAGDTILQITVLSGDLGDHHSGHSVAAEFGRRWQIRNYNLHWLISAVFESENVSHYYFGIDSDQADSDFPVYRADDSWRIFTELGLTLALSEHWVFRGHARYAHLSNAISDSPFIEDSYATFAALSVSYVF